MLNIVMPLAGKGQRFKDAGYKDPKPLIDVCGRPMASLVLYNILPRRDRHVFIIARKNGILVRDNDLRVTAVWTGGDTQGAACSVLCAEQHLDNYDPLLIVNGDQYIDGLDIEDFLDFAKDYHGCIATFKVPKDEPPKWSYVRRWGFLEDVLLVAEKEPISNEATCGLYWFRHGRDFLRAAHSMITQDKRVNGEFYICPVYNEMIMEGLSVGAYDVGNGNMWGLGTPTDLERFIKEGPLAKGTAA